MSERRRRAAPVPGRPVRGSTNGRPLLAAMDLLGRRWALRILWELRDEAVTFRGLQERCDGLSPASLNTRLSELREAGLVELVEGGYAVTVIGGELATALVPLQQWSERWARSRRV